HQRAAAVGRALDRDAKAQQKHQAARIKIALADQLAKAGRKPQYFLPTGIRGLAHGSPRTFETSNYSNCRDVPRRPGVAGILPCPLAARRPVETFLHQVPDDIGRRRAVQLLSMKAL